MIQNLSFRPLYRFRGANARKNACQSGTFPRSGRRFSVSLPRYFRTSENASDRNRTYARGSGGHCSIHWATDASLIVYNNFLIHARGWELFFCIFFHSIFLNEGCMRPGTFKSPARSLAMICIFAWMRGSSRGTVFPFPDCRAFHVFNAFLKTDSRTEYDLRSPPQELSGCSKQSHLRLSLFRASA